MCFALLVAKSTSQASGSFMYAPQVSPLLWIWLLVNSAIRVGGPPHRLWFSSECTSWNVGATHLCDYVNHLLGTSSAQKPASGTTNIANAVNNKFLIPPPNQPHATIQSDRVKSNYVGPRNYLGLGNCGRIPYLQLSAVMLRSARYADQRLRIVLPAPSTNNRCGGHNSSTNRPSYCPPARRSRAQSIFVALRSSLANTPPHRPSQTRPDATSSQLPGSQVTDGRWPPHAAMLPSPQSALCTLQCRRTRRAGPPRHRSPAQRESPPYHRIASSSAPLLRRRVYSTLPSG